MNIILILVIGIVILTDVITVITMVFIVTVMMKKKKIRMMTDYAYDRHYFSSVEGLGFRSKFVRHFDCFSGVCCTEAGCTGAYAVRVLSRASFCRELFVQSSGGVVWEWCRSGGRWAGGAVLVSDPVVYDSSCGAVGGICPVCRDGGGGLFGGLLHLHTLPLSGLRKLAWSRFEIAGDGWWLVKCLPDAPGLWHRPRSTTTRSSGTRHRC